MPASRQQPELSNLDALFDDFSTAVRLRSLAPGYAAALSTFWTTALAREHLSPRLAELILLALHASASSLNVEAIRRHVARARAAGASEADVLDVLVSIVGIGIHALYFAVPILMQELEAAGREDATVPPPRADIAAFRDEFVRTRGFWNDQRDVIARLLPDYFIALAQLSMEPWKAGSLSAKEREFLYIAIDCSITHAHAPGLAMHIRHALGYGATREEILAIFQLAGAMGVEGFVVGAGTLLSDSESR